MEWSRNRATYLFGLGGVLLGTIFFSLGIWLESNRHHLPITPWAFFYLHRTEPMVFLLDLAPFLSGIVGGLIGVQRGLLTVIQQGKRELELIFDSISDPMVFTDEDDRILRCNRAIVDRFNTTFREVIGRNLYEVVKTDQRFDRMVHSFNWLDRTYDVSGSTVFQDGSKTKKLISFHDITDRKQAETTLEQTETLFKAMLDLLPDAVGSSRVDLQACKLEYSIVSPK